MPADATGPAAALTTLLATMLQAQLDAFPEYATRLGLDTGAQAARRSRLDASAAPALAAYIGRLRGFAQALRGIEAQGLDAMQRIDRDAVLFHAEVLLEGARLLPQGAPTDFQPYVVTQLSGAYQSLPDLLCTKHPLQTAADAEAFLARLQAFGPALHDEAARIQADAAAGVAPPAFVLDTTLRQLQTLLDTPAARSPIVKALAQGTHQRAIAGDWEAAATAQVQQSLQPAVQSLMAVLQRLHGTATDEAGVCKLPGGDAWYAQAIVAQTTTRKSPHGLPKGEYRSAQHEGSPGSADEIHRVGLDQVAEITARIDTALRAQGWNDGSVAARLAALAQDERYIYPNDARGKARLLDELRTLVAEMQARLPEMFDPLPRAGLEVRGVPPEIEAGAPRGYYTAGPADGSRPGAFYANLRDTRDWKRWYAPSFAYHEGVPGHHLQIALALETEGISMMRRTLWFAAYGEGWALYAEQLADEMGFYDRNPMGRVGYLQSMLFRAARLVVDTGLHARRWTRQQAIAYLVSAVGETVNRATAEVDRYCVMPAQALSYKIGHLRWQQLRMAAQARLGAAFDLRRFHSDTLRWGAMPLDLLDQLG
jgi:uncharacterized protein (DUF885 family)